MTTTLAEALATALHDDECLHEDGYGGTGWVYCTRRADEILAHEAVAAWLREQDEALVALDVALNDSQDSRCMHCRRNLGQHNDWCIHVVHVAAIAAARARLGQ